MRPNGISNNIRSKFNEWVSTITDSKVRNLVRNGSIITGGCIVSMWLDEKIHDYDIYFKNHETTMAVAKYYADKYNNQLDEPVKIIDCSELNEGSRQGILGIIDPERIYIMIEGSGISHCNASSKEIEDNTRYLPKVITCNAITLHDDIQLIIRFHGNVDEIHSNFDFVHATCYWTSWNERLISPNKALEAILSKQLIYNGSKYPFSSIIRTRKFIKRGWNISAGEYLKMSFQISDLDFTNVNVLADQLVGVDTIYFHELISKIANDKGTNSINIDHMYIKDLVDEIFN